MPGLREASARLSLGAARRCRGRRELMGAATALSSSPARRPSPRKSGVRPRGLPRPRPPGIRRSRRSSSRWRTLRTPSSTTSSSSTPRPDGPAAAAGAHADEGFIVATRDGGRTWAVQFGAPASPTPGVARLFFIDATHGWATQSDGTMLRTTDGSSWAPVGEIAHPVPSSSSPRQGVLARRSSEYPDDCRRRGHVDDGLSLPGDHRRRRRHTRAGCEPEAITFAPDRTTGYVIRAGAR